MKKTIILAAALSLFGCSKTATAEKSSVSKNYQGLDHSVSKVTIENSGEKNEILEILSPNGKKIQLDLKNSSGNIKNYERSGITAESKGDSLILKQDGNVIPLVEIK